MEPRFPLILKSAYGPVFIELDSILRIDAEDKYSRLHYTNGSNAVLMHSLSDLEVRLACGQRIADRVFMRTHRSCIVALHHAKGLKGRDRVLLNGQAAPVSRSAWASLIGVLGSVGTTK
ncbi:MAG: LytTR family transcriptional regulator [Flavobacteriales bacterium]|nr:LytTR family transcriptional regulator [Flavobacteriales bacterium]